MPFVYGLDGCHGGWCAVRLDLEGDSGRVHDPAVLSLDEVIASDAETICIDIPIGLLDCPGPRGCDAGARRVLGFPRATSVFPAPSRKVLPLCSSPDNYVAACDLNFQVTGRRLTRQTFHIASKIAEVDQAITVAGKDRIREVHPEVCFWALNGRKPMAFNKKKTGGRMERWAILRKLMPSLPPEPQLPPEIKSRCGWDDYIDALVAAWTAACLVRGTATRIPDHPPPDERGLRMEMWLPYPG